MRTNTLRSLILILALVAVATWIAWPTNREINLNLGGIRLYRDIAIREGLDLQGGIQVLLAPDPAAGAISGDQIQAARDIIEKRVNALGVSEPVIYIGQQNRIIVEIPGIRDPDQAIRTFGQTGLLEFIDAGFQPLPEGASVATSRGRPAGTGDQAAVTLATPGAGTPAVVATGTATATQPVTATRPIAAPEQVYTTILEGRHLQSADVGFDQFSRPQVNFTFTGEGSTIFGDYTSKNVGRYLAITMDKVVLSSPVIRSAIVGGTGVIEGKFTLHEVRDLVLQLKYGALPVPLKVVQNRTVGPTLGQDSVQKSIVAGLVGLGIVAAFMLLYYRVPGLIAVVGLLIYAVLSFAVFKLVPVTLTLAGIAGFILSIGMAVDANILIFERMREELRAGRSAHAAVENGFGRAWTSIRDSNVSTLITCAILFWFGATFGASIIQGFALTLALGVLVSLFTAIVVTHTILRAALSLLPPGLLARWFGVRIETTGAPATT